MNMVRLYYVNMIIFSCFSILHIMANKSIMKHSLSLITSLSICFSDLNPMDHSIFKANAATTKTPQSLSEQIKVIQTLQNRPTIVKPYVTRLQLFRLINVHTCLRIHQIISSVDRS